ncbi:MAG: hypothetical protein LC624_07380 [Halobacteriales archaeon]|nr:hypothetical protein [Halobacteriales archaeon]
MTNATLPPNATARLDATLPRPFASILGLARGEGAANTTLALEGPGFRGAANATSPAAGAWSLVARSTSAAPANVTLAIRVRG